VPFISETHRNAVAGDGPDFLDQPILQFMRPFTLEKIHDRRPTGQKFRAVSPMAVLRVGERHASRIAAVPGIFGQAGLLGRGRGIERREGWTSGLFGHFGAFKSRRKKFLVFRGEEGRLLFLRGRLGEFAVASVYETMSQGGLRCRSLRKAKRFPESVMG